MTSAAVTMIGMPDTGKSSYLAALYHALTAPSGDTAPRLSRQPKARAYLEELRQAWLRGEKPGRTSSDSGELVQLEIDIPGTGGLSLAVPDIAGETFESVFVQRRADTAVTELVRDADGLLLFTHPNHQRPRVPIAAMKRMQALAGDDDTPPTAGDDERPFDARAVPGEVQLVDLLQWTDAVRRPRRSATRLSIVVSAWDRAGTRPPGEWLSRRMPMLDRYLQARPDDVLPRVYGVCAQGGDYDEDKGVAQRRPAERAYAVLADGSRTDDLTLALRWAALG